MSSEAEHPPHQDRAKRLAVLAMVFGTWCVWAPAALIYVFGAGPLGLLMALVVIIAAVPFLERVARSWQGPRRGPMV
jgi:hypothetical protein